MVQTKKEVVTLENGCICCTLRGDLIREVNRIRETQQFDYVLIESTGIAEPQQVAESFCVDPETQQLAHEEEQMLWNTARLDACVTVVDVVHFSSYLSSLQRFQHVFHDGLDDAEPQEGEKSISELMVEQVEFANIILLNKVDLVSNDKVQETQQLIESLNPKARVVACSYGKIELQEILNTHLFDMEQARASPGWLVSLEHGVTASEGEADEYGVQSFVYRERRPFHPKRLHAFLTQFFCFAEDWNSQASYIENNKEETTTNGKIKKVYGSIFRSKGTCWIAGRDQHEMAWAQTGRIIQLSPTAPWYCLTPPDEWDVNDDDGQEERARIQGLFQNDERVRYEFGDRRQELVLIGTNLQQEAIRQGLDGCLLTKEELKRHSAFSPAGTYPDPLHPQLVACQGSSSLFMICRQGQNQHLKIFPGSKLSLQNFALNVRQDAENHIDGVKVWLDKSDDNEHFGLLLATLRPQTYEQHSLSLELLPCDKEGGEEVVNRRIRVQVCPKKNAPTDMDWMETCEIHVMGMVEPLPYSEDSDEDDEEQDDYDDDVDCDDGACAAGA